MGAIASCKFPLIDKFKDLGEKNPIVGYIDSVLSGFGQIVLSDNPVTGLCIMAAIYFGSPLQFLLALWCACVASAFAFLIGIDKFAVRHGFYTFGAAVIGLGISLWGYSLTSITIEMLAVATVGAIVCVFLTAALNGFLSKWEAPSLSIPYCVTLIVMVPSLWLMQNLEATPLLNIQTATMTDAFVGIDSGMFLEACILGVAEICFQASLLSGVFLILALLISSRIDALVAVTCSIIGTAFALLIGLPTEGILIGLYGYNAALVGIGLFGRSFKMSIPCALFTLLMVIFSVFMTAGFTVLFMPIGAPVAALPFGLIVIGSIMAKGALSKLKPVSILLWGVPETIAKAIKEETKE